MRETAAAWAGFLIFLTVALCATLVAPILNCNCDSCAAGMASWK